MTRNTSIIQTNSNTDTKDVSRSHYLPFVINTVIFAVSETFPYTA